MAAATRLTAEIADLENRLATAGSSYRDQRTVGGELARLRWLLSAYPESTRRRNDK